MEQLNFGIAGTTQRKRCKVENLRSKKESHCKIINDTCPYDYFCHLCRLYIDYEKTKEKAAKLKTSIEAPK